MRNELKIGLTVILAVFVGYAGLRFMSNAPMFTQGTVVSAEFSRVDGLTSGGQVLMNGVKIGSINRIELLPDNRVQVTMLIEQVVQLPEDSKALLTSTGLLEGKVIVIEPGSSSQSVVDGGVLDGVYVDSMMETFSEMGEGLGEDVSASFNELNQLLAQLNATLDDASWGAITQTIDNVQSATYTMADIVESRQQELEQTISSINRMMSQLDTLATDNRPRVDSLLTSLEAFAGDFQKISEELDVTVDQLNQILFKINEGEGSIGRLVNDPSFYHNADSLSVELRELIKGINENPGRYLRHLNLIDLF